VPALEVSEAVAQHGNDTVDHGASHGPAETPRRFEELALVVIQSSPDRDVFLDNVDPAFGQSSPPVQHKGSRARRATRRHQELASTRTAPMAVKARSAMAAVAMDDLVGSVGEGWPRRPTRGWTPCGYIDAVEIAITLRG
jgi:hypothetical protein